MTELDLRETLERHLEAVDVPPAPLGPVVLKGRRRRNRRRRAVIGASVTAVLAAVAASGAALVMSDDEGRGVDTSQFASLGALDFSHGARAYASPGQELHLAGRTFPYGDLEYLDTDAVATSYGMVFYRRRPADAPRRPTARSAPSSTARSTTQTASIRRPRPTRSTRGWPTPRAVGSPSP